jgi:thiamine-phosphate pyrophosphorylase
MVVPFARLPQVRLHDARLYFICDCAQLGALEPALRGGVDIFQLRDKDASDDALLRAAQTARALCDEHGALFVLNDRPDLVERCGADGVHVGQGDAPVLDARRHVGAERLVGLSATTADELAGEPDYFGVGAVYGTPTKPESDAGGLPLVWAARDRLRVPWFAIGGVDASNVEDLNAAGAAGIAVVRAIRDADDPEGAARDLRASLPPTDAVVSSGDTEISLPQLDWLEWSLPAAELGAAPHVHAAHTAVFYAFDGNLELRLGGETVRVPAGSCVAAPPLLVHGFRVPEGDAQYLNLHVPGSWARSPEGMSDTHGVERASARARPVVSAPGDGDRLAKPHRLSLVRVDLPELAFVENIVDAEFEGPEYHVHLLHADCFHVLEGALELVADGTPVRAEPGTSVVIPPGVEHEFTSAGRARFLNVHAPSCGFAEYLRRVDGGEDVDTAAYDVHVMRRAG